MKVVREEIKEDQYRFTGNLIELDNAVIAFFDETGSMKLGTLAIAVPQQGRRPSISSILLGERNVIITKILAERLVHTYNKIALVSTHFAEIEDQQRGSILLRLVQKLSAQGK